jgi:hypothetical protein
MPRDGSGVMSAPAGTTATPNTTILSAAYNAFVADLIADLNAARPVTAGGTGGTSVITGWDGLAAKGTDIASASSINLTTATGPSVTITGTATIASVTLAEGSFRIVRAGGAFTWDASSSLLVNGSSTTDVTAAANDLFLVRGGASSVVSVVGLGSATTAAATTSAAGIVELATAAEALTGTDATRAVTPAGLANLYSIALNNAIEIADLKGSRLNMAGGIADAYDSETDVDTATSTNETYDSGNDLYSPSSTAGPLISQGTGTAIGDMTAGGGLAAAFDGNANQAMLASAHRAAVNGYVGKNYSSDPKRIGQVKATAANNNGFGGSTSHNISITIYGKNGGAPSNGTDGTSLGTTGTITVTGSQVVTIVSTDSATSWDYVWAYVVNVSAAAFVAVCELEFYLNDTINNMTLVSNAFTATAVPTVARVATFIDPQESITINTDFTAEVSRDGGTTWTAATLALVSNPVGTVEQYEGTVSISAQPSGSSMKYRLKTLNNKDIDVTGTVFQWS